MRRPHHLTRTLTFLQLFSVTMVLASVLLVALTRFASVVGLPELHPHLADVQDANSQGVRIAAIVDLDYATYEGVFNASTGLNVFKG